MRALQPTIVAVLGRCVGSIALACLAACGSGGAGGKSAPPLPGDYPPDLPRPQYQTIEMKLGGETLTVEVADTPAKRAYGMMFVSKLPDDWGMMFVYPTPRPLGFWMRNTQIPLDIVFIAELGDSARIINTHANMVPFQESPSYKSLGDCRFALELPAGFVARHGVKASDMIEIPGALLELKAVDDDPFGENLPRRIGP